MAMACPEAIIIISTAILSYMLTGWCRCLTCNGNCRTHCHQIATTLHCTSPCSQGNCLQCVDIVAPYRFRVIAVEVRTSSRRICMYCSLCLASCVLASQVYSVPSLTTAHTLSDKASSPLMDHQIFRELSTCASHRKNTYPQHMNNCVYGILNDCSPWI